MPEMEVGDPVQLRLFHVTPCATVDVARRWQAPLVSACTRRGFHTAALQVGRMPKLGFVADACIATPPYDPALRWQGH